MGTVPALGFSIGAAVASNTVNASGNSGTISINQGYNFGAVLTVSQITGVGAQINVALQVSEDNGSTWTDVWHFEPLTAAGSSIMPYNKIAGLHRYVWTVIGTTPAVTFAITETGGTQDAKLVRRFFDYSAGLLAGTLNQTSNPYRVDGSSGFTFSISLANVGTAGSYEAQISPDGVNWGTLPGDSSHAAVVNGTLVWSAPVGTIASYLRIICSVAAAVATSGGVASIAAA